MSKFVLIFIFALAIFLRFYNLSSIPGSLNQDEAAIGYNAYALLKTGADEHGKFFPLSMESFGDWKLPIYSLVTIPFIVIFGLTEFSVRITSAIAGVVGVFLIYKIAGLLFKNKKIQLFSAFFFAVSPWSIYLSRAAYEVNLATTFFLAGVYYLFSYLTSKQKNSKILPATVFFCLTIFTYHTYILFAPLFLLGSLAVFYKKITLDKWVAISLILMLFFMCLSFAILRTNGANKISNLSIINNESVVYNRADSIKGDGAVGNPILEKIIYNKYTAVGYQFAQNYINVFSPEFLFDKGGEKLQHNLGYFGNFYLFDVILLAVGILSLFWFHEKVIIFLIPWVAAGPVSSAFTTDAPNSTRLFVLLPLAIIVMAYGAGKIIDILKNIKFANLYLGFLIFIFTANLIFFLDGYFVHFNSQRLRYWRYGNKQAVELANKYPEYKIVVRGPEDFRYIYFLFYNRYDPQKFRKEVSYYPLTDEGFLYVKSFGRYRFVNSIDYTNLEEKTIYIDDRSVQNLPKTIDLPSGEPILGYIISEDGKK